MYEICHRQPRGMHGKVPENTRSLKAESHEETGIEMIHNRSSLLSPQLFEAYDLGRLSEEVKAEFTTDVAGQRSAACAAEIGRQKHFGKPAVCSGTALGA